MEGIFDLIFLSSFVILPYEVVCLKEDPDNVIQYYHGKQIRNFEAWYMRNGTYVEEFDTDDGHFYLTAEPKDYPDEIREEAIEFGIIDEHGFVIPYIDNPQ